MQALIVVDIQNDFLPGGALAVPRGDEVIPVANQLMRRFGIVAATKDWHPADHGSFASQHPGQRVGDVVDLAGIAQVLWPDHCVQNTHGAALAGQLDQTRLNMTFCKGMDRMVDSYSGLFDNAHRHATGLDGWLRGLGIGEIFIVGLATDYCVRNSALDAVELGLRTCVVEPGCRGVNLMPRDSEQALADMRQAGVEIITTLADPRLPDGPSQTK